MADLFGAFSTETFIVWSCPLLANSTDLNRSIAIRKEFKASFSIVVGFFTRVMGRSFAFTGGPSTQLVIMKRMSAFPLTST